MSSPSAPPLRLLYAGTCRPNTTPQSVHEIRFKRPVHLHSFRILCDGEAPHAEIPAIVGQTPNVQLGVEPAHRHEACDGDCNSEVAC